MAIGISQYVKETCSQRYPYFRESEGYRTYGQRESKESPTVLHLQVKKWRLREDIYDLGLLKKREV